MPTARPSPDTLRSTISQWADALDAPTLDRTPANARLRGFFAHLLDTLVKDTVAPTPEDALLSAAMGAMPIMGAVAPAAKPALGSIAKAIRGYHVSPHDFSQFDLNAATKGVGRQIFGPGLYFGGQPEAIEVYAKNFLAQRPASKIFKYDTDIAANPAEFIRYNEPLRDQSPSVQRLADDLLDTSSAPLHQLQHTNPSGRDLVESLREDALSRSRQSRMPSPTDIRAHILKTLQQRNIPGVSYRSPPGLTGGAILTEPNYVVADDRLLTIVKKLGVGGALAAGLITQAQADAFRTSPPR